MSTLFTFDQIVSLTEDDLVRLSIELQTSSNFDDVIDQLVVHKRIDNRDILNIIHPYLPIYRTLSVVELQQRIINDQIQSNDRTELLRYLTSPEYAFNFMSMEYALIMHKDRGILPHMFNNANIVDSEWIINAIRNDLNNLSLGQTIYWSGVRIIDTKNLDYKLLGIKAKSYSDITVDDIYKANSKNLKSILKIMNKCRSIRNRPEPRNIESLPLYDQKIDSPSMAWKIATEGYRISDEDIKELNLDPEILRDIYLYPPTNLEIDYIYSLSRLPLKNYLLSLGYSNTDVVRFMNDKELAFFASRCYPPSVDIQGRINRLQMLESLDTNKLNKLKLLYDTQNMVKIARNYHPYEAFILNMDTMTIEELSVRSGMIIPDNMITQEEKWAYYNNFWGRYANLFTRKNFIPMTYQEFVDGDVVQVESELYEKYSDFEIFNLIKARFSYQLPVDISKRAVAGRTKDMFFVPIQSELPFKCANDTTLVMFEDTYVQDYVDSPDIIAFGKWHDYYCFSLDEIDSWFREYDNEFHFRKPQLYQPGPLGEAVIYEDLTKAEVNDFVALLKMLKFRSNDEEYRRRVEQVITNINNNIQHIINFDDYTRNIRLQFDRFNSTQKRLMQDGFRLFFETGMKIRRWKGPGYPYPHRFAERGTYRVEGAEYIINPEDIINVSVCNNEATPAALVSVKEKLDEMDTEARQFFLSLFYYEIRDEEFTRHTETINGLYNSIISRIVRGDVQQGYCIQMQSLYFVSTGAYYLLSFYNQPVEGLDIKKVRYMHYPDS